MVSIDLKVFSKISRYIYGGKVTEKHFFRSKVFVQVNIGTCVKYHMKTKYIFHHLFPLMFLWFAYMCVSINLQAWCYKIKRKMILVSSFTVICKPSFINYIMQKSGFFRFLRRLQNLRITTPST